MAIIPSSALARREAVMGREARTLRVRERSDSEPRTTKPGLRHAN
jgi:hypothetical protein